MMQLLQWVPEPVRALLRPNPAWYGLAAAIILTWMGIEAIATVQPTLASAQASRWLPIALLVMVICMIPHPRMIGHSIYLLLGVVLLMLVILLIPGIPRWIIPVINGARRWIDLQFMLLQPSELAKVTAILALSWYLRYRENYRTLLGLLIPFVIMLVPVALIYRQPDLGTAALFAPTLFAMLVAAGAKLRHLGVLVGLAVMLIAVNVAIVMVLPESMQVLKPHQRTRIVAMISQAQGDTRYIRDIGYQQHKAVTLAGAGGLTGYGEAKSAMVIGYNHLPEPHTDMIFAVIVNRWGLVGAITVMGLYAIIVLSCIGVSVRSKDPFAKLACVGFAAIIFTQAMINIGMNIGVLPITGLTLPFMSYGGSSLVALFAMIGLTLNFASRRPALLSRPSFEFDRRTDAVFQ
jgi:cell division protein FtsW (lipid II flippase)